ncbi:nucleotide-diphospho-sugar transferase [Aspergillus novoparasiticus]|uniref:Nucleotide-diphospho-sugar transferase n=1 Tax=Aspergillus novoparasiticus TaxID=986946 RepID=A0A5N6EFG6_9EURO|nr:nucleotide-diphospho-sugar transferase [Aspergillus novoparasiticus]
MTPHTTVADISPDECCGEQLFTLTSTKGELAPRLPQLRLVGQNDLPLVEIFVPCCGESLDIILDTARAACAIDYPTARFCVTVLDDGNSAALHKAIADLRKIWPNLSYHSRGVKPNAKVFAKAGNLNYGLFEIKRHFPPEFIAIMDADCMPTPDFLRATLPHLLTRSKLAIVGSAQYYYNLPDGDPLDQALDYYSAIKIPQLNRLGKSFASGSGCVIRYSTLLKTGGFPTFGSVEDVTLSSILTQSGDQILVLTEMVQLGLIPGSFEGHVLQTSRHKVGVSEQILAWSPSTSNTIPPRYRSALGWIGLSLTWKIMVRFITNIFIPLALASGQQLVPTTLLRLQMVLAVSYISNFWLYEWLRAAHTGFRVSTFHHLREWFLATRHMYALLHFYLFSFQSSSKRPARSVVTGSTQNPWNLPTASQSQAKRFYKDFFAPTVLINMIYFTGTLVTIAYSIWSCYSENSENDKLFTRVAWPPMLLLCYLTLTSSFTPLRCSIWPLRYPNRKLALGPHPNHAQAVFPKEDVRLAVMKRQRPPLGEFYHLVLVPVVLAALMYFALVV